MPTPTRVIAEERFELAVENVALNPNAAVRVHMPGDALGPPFKLELVVRHTDAWPAVLVDVRISGINVMTFLTEEPRLKIVAGLLQNEVS